MTERAAYRASRWPLWLRRGPCEAVAIELKYLFDLFGRSVVDLKRTLGDLLAELGELFSQLNVPFDGTLGVQAKSEYRTDRRPYQQVFTEEQRKIIEKAFAKEIELHGYRF